MNIPSTSVVRDLYEHNDHHYYPEMEKTIEEAMNHPESPTVEIPDNFLSSKLDKTNFFMEGMRKIKFFFQGLALNTKCLFSASYRKDYERALNKIEIAYSKKYAEISKLANIIMLNREPIEDSKKLVADLNNRVKVLKEEIQTEEEKLIERRAAKDLIVQEARALKVEKEHVPTTYETIVNFIAYYNPFGSGVAKGPDHEAAIKELDDSFPFDDLTDSNIEAYQKEEYDRSKLLLQIKQGETGIVEKRQLLEQEEKMLAAVRALLAKPVDKIKTAAAEIQRLHLENFFDDQDLEVPDIAEEKAVVVPKVLTPQEMQLEAISQDITQKTGNKDLGVLLTTLLKRLPENAITNWQCDAAGNFTLKLNEVHNIWMPEGKLKGGAVIMLGYQKDGEIKGKLERNKVLFESGVNSYVKAPIALLGYIDPTFDGIQFNSKIDVQIGGTYMGQTQWKQKTYSALKKDWESNGTYIEKTYPGGYETFLQEKVAQE